MKFKRKTSKSAKKRFKITGRGRVIRRGVAINHFNAKDSGSQRRHRKESKPLDKDNRGNLNELMPYDFPN